MKQRRKLRKEDLESDVFLLMQVMGDERNYVNSFVV